MATFYIKHITKYSYSSTVIDGANLIRLHPIIDDYQKVLSHTITISTNGFVQTFTDFFNNTIGTFMSIEPHDFLTIQSEVQVVTSHRPYPDDSADIKTQWDELKTLKNQSDFIDFLSFTRFNGSKDILDMLETKDLNTNSPYIIVQELCDYVFNNFKYITGITNVDSSLDDVWKLKAGVCQDFTNVLLQMVRMIGIPARYVSGYICANENITRGEGATHAWIEAYIPDYGWLGLDPTNNIIANENHVRLAVGRHYNDCAPVKGVFKGKVDEDLYVKVEVNTKKNLSESVIPPNTFIGSESNNSYQQNLERIQQQQQQQ